MRVRCRFALFVTTGTLIALTAVPAGATSTTLSREIPLSVPILGPAARDQKAPACASDGEQYFVAWIDDRGGIRGTRVRNDGYPLDPTGVLLATSGSFIISPPRVLFDGTSFIVLSGDVGAGTVTMSRVSRDGLITQRDRRIFLPSRFHPYITRVAWNGRVFLVAWIDARLFGPSEFHLSVLDPDGSVLREVPAYPIAMASDGVGFLTITRIRPAGDVIDREPIRLTRSWSQYAVASDGRDFLVAWREVNGPVRGSVVSAAGDFGRMITVVWHRDSFTVAWTEERAIAIGGRLVARRVAADGTFASGVFGLTSRGDEDRASALAVSPNGSLAVVYERVSPEREYGSVSRAFLRLLGTSRRSPPVQP